MTDSNVVNMPTPMNVLADKIRAAYERTENGKQEWIEGTLELGALLVEARSRFPAHQQFSLWLTEHRLNFLGENDQASLISMAAEPNILRDVLTEQSDVLHPITIWRKCRSRFGQPSITTPEPTLIPNPQPEPATEAKVENQEPSEAKVEAKTATKSEKTKKSESKLYRLGDDVADVLMAKFKNPRMLAHFLGGDDSRTKKRSRMLRYLAARIKADYPEEYLASKSWETRLLYPYLPPKMLEKLAKHINMIDANHATLAATEELFMKTPECGVTDPPMIAFNKAYSIYQSLSHAKNNGGAPIDRSAFVHKPTFAPDEGKHPVIVRGTQLWPRETSETYCYDDLRCAFGMAEDILLTFLEPKDAPMTTKSLKLRHVSAWLPPNGYNAVGATLEGVMRAWKLVVYAYGADKSEEMRKPEASLRKQGE